MRCVAALSGLRKCSGRVVSAVLLVHPISTMQNKVDVLLAQSHQQYLARYQKPIDDISERFDVSPIVLKKCITEADGWYSSALREYCDRMDIALLFLPYEESYIDPDDFDRPVICIKVLVGALLDEEYKSGRFGIDRWSNYSQVSVYAQDRAAELCFKAWLEADNIDLK